MQNRHTETGFVMKDIYWIGDSRSFKLLTIKMIPSFIELPVPQRFLGRVASCFIQTSPASNHEMVVTVFPPRPFNVWFDFYGAKVSFWACLFLSRALSQRHPAIK
jgi:hypothetical protein